MNLDDIKQILDLVREHELEEFELEQDGLKVRVRKAGTEVRHVAPTVQYVQPPPMSAPSAPAPVPASASASGPEPADAVDLGLVKSPIVGTFYRSNEPGARPFVDVGDTVKKGQVLCIIEAMKLMNEIESDTNGEITQIHSQNAQAVEFGQPLFSIRAA